MGLKSSVKYTLKDRVVPQMCGLDTCLLDRSDRSHHATCVHHTTRHQPRQQRPNFYECNPWRKATCAHHNVRDMIKRKWRMHWWAHMACMPYKHSHKQGHREELADRQRPRPNFQTLPTQGNDMALNDSLLANGTSARIYKAIAQVSDAEPRLKSPTIVPFASNSKDWVHNVLQILSSPTR